MLEQLESLPTAIFLKIQTQEGKWNRINWESQGSRSLPNDENGKGMPFVIVGDEAFRLVRTRVTAPPE